MSAPLPRLFTPQQVAEAWAVDVSTIRRIFQDLPDVLKLGRGTARNGKRSYTTLRIPADVLARVQRELSK